MRQSSMYETVDFPWAETFRSNAQAIRRELATFEKMLQEGGRGLPLIHTFSQQEAKLNKDGAWKALFVRVTGSDTPLAARHFSLTAGLLREAEGKGMKAWSCFFSVLEPDGKIPWHYGIFRGVLRYHLGVEVPEDSGARLTSTIIRGPNAAMVHNFSFGWRFAEDRLFDDTEAHMVQNKGSQRRIILVLDVPRFDLPWYMSLLNEVLLWWVSPNFPSAAAILKKSAQYANGLPTKSN